MLAPIIDRHREVPGEQDNLHQKPTSGVPGFAGAARRDTCVQETAIVHQVGGDSCGRLV